MVVLHNYHLDGIKTTGSKNIQDVKIQNTKQRLDQFNVFLGLFPIRVKILRQNINICLLFSLPPSLQNVVDSNRNLFYKGCSGSKQSSGNTFYKFDAMCLLSRGKKKKKENLKIRF